MHCIWRKVKHITCMLYWLSGMCHQWNHLCIDPGSVTPMSILCNEFDCIRHSSVGNQYRYYQHWKYRCHQHNSPNTGNYIDKAEYHCYHTTNKLKWRCIWHNPQHIVYIDLHQQNNLLDRYSSMNCCEEGRGYCSQNN